MRMTTPAINRRLALSTLLVVAVTLALVAAEQPHVTHAVGATIFVTTTADEDTMNGICSLREAIIASNTDAFYNGCRADEGTFGTDDQIQFLIGISGHEIDIGSTPLPPITQWVTIDGHDTEGSRVVIHGPGGPLVSGANGLTIAASAVGTTISSLVINNSADGGILIDADEVVVMDSFIGTDEIGQLPAPNQGFGIQTRGSADVIGPRHPPGPGEHCGLCGNLIAGNKKSNVLLDRTPTDVATLNMLHENEIGTIIGGSEAMPGNNVPGVEDKGDGNTIGGPEGITIVGSCTGDCNLISGNSQDGGILLDANATGTVVEGNFIGTDVTGKNPVPNSVSPDLTTGIVDMEPSATIGGTGAFNVISGNNFINLDIEAFGALVVGNFIGTTSDLSGAVDGNGIGVLVSNADSARIGSNDQAGNLIGGNTVGIDLINATNAQLFFNLIGVNMDLATPIPNTSDGVLIRGGSNNNIVGSTANGNGNYIAYNGGDGVDINNDTPTTRSNTVRGNSIYSNNARGIELKNGANDSLAPPVILGASPLHGTSCAMCNLDIYSDDEDEGRVYQGSVFTNDGNWTFTDPVAGPNVTATNTDVSNNTSEFSTPFVIFTPTPSPSPTPTGSPTSELTQGDVNCDGAINVNDFKFLLDYAAGLDSGVPPGDCPDLGEAVPAGAIALFPWGDVNCDNAVDAVDALYILRYVANLPLTAQNCVPIGGGAR